MTDLQSKILHHICTTVNANYKTLLEEIDKSRITILQSLESLIKYRYILKQKVNPRYEKIKLFFVPTHKGISYACLELKLDPKVIINTKNDEIGRYIEFVTKTFHYSQLQRQILEPMFTKLERGYLEFEDDNTVKKNELIKDSFIRGLVQLAQSGNYDAYNLFSNDRKKWDFVFSNEELRELKRICMHTGNNLIKTGKRIPAKS